MGSSLQIGLLARCIHCGGLEKGVVHGFEPKLLLLGGLAGAISNLET
jgi:hypothetical protein